MEVIYWSFITYMKYEREVEHNTKSMAQRASSPLTNFDVLTLYYRILHNPKLQV